jgi:hypothetical protein
MAPADGEGNARPLVRSFIRRFNTNSQAAHVETDRGEYVIKAINNRNGPPILIAEWIGSMAARWLGLPVPDFDVVELMAIVEVPLDAGGREFAQPGPCFGSRFVVAAGWDGDGATLAQVENQEIIPAVVVVDTWLRNLDRFCRSVDGTVRFNNPGNILLQTDGAPKGKFRLTAIDFGHSLGGPSWSARRLAEISSVQDELIYGCFPAFRPYMQRGWLDSILQRLNSSTAEDMRAVVRPIPPEWKLSAPDADAIVEFLWRRARYLAEKLNNMVWEDDRLWGVTGAA